MLISPSRDIVLGAMQSAYPDHQIARFPSGTLAAIDAVLHEGESRSAFIRLAVRDLVEKRRVAAECKPERKPAR